MFTACMCGHSIEEHPFGKGCAECDCIAYDPMPDEDELEEGATNVSTQKRT